MNATPRRTEQMHSVEAANDNRMDAPKVVDVAGHVKSTLLQSETQAGVDAIIGAEVVESNEASEGADDEGGVFSENAKDNAGSGGGGATNAAYIPPAPVIPPEPVMKKQVEAAIRHEIRQQEKQVLSHYIGWKPLKPEELEGTMKHLRNLKNVLAEALDAASDALLSLYRRWVLKEGATEK